MARTSFWVPGVSATTGLLLLWGSGCAKDFDALSAQYGQGGSSSGNTGKAGASGGKAGSPASGGNNPGDGGVGAASGEGGEAGEDSGAGKGGTGGKAGSGGKGGAATGGGHGEMCMVGFTTCLGSPECSTDVKVGTPDGVGVTDCGDCGVSCSLEHASGATCKAGACVPACQAGFDDCNASSKNDGCEADLSSPLSCSACGIKCSLAGATMAECATGSCLAMCSPSYADCNGSTVPTPNDGCEVYLDSHDECKATCAGSSIACAPTQLCSAGSCVSAAGVAVLSTPLTTAAQSMRFANPFPLDIGLEGASLTVRAYAPGATGGTLNIFLSDFGSHFSPTVIITPLATVSQKWTDITVPIASLDAFDANNAKQVNVEVHSGSTGPWTNPTVVYVDSIRSSNLLVNETFDTSSAPFTKSSIVVVAGASLDWAASVP
ncbi:MAG TPA: hypothetical protein VJV79_22525 [Polyangiaceae bacterium]|nr:hypothetical protein [Polyangiaceae bacterium]